MKERPILFTGAMVRALLDGSKTQTRRIIKGQAAEWQTVTDEEDIDGREFFVVCGEKEPSGLRPILDEVCCPYGQSGDRLWVREAFAFTDTHEPEYDRSIDFRADGKCYAVNGNQLFDVPSLLDPFDGPWRPSIHMPRWASRILLEITSVRVERLQDISEADCWAEGIEAVDGALDDMAILDLAKRMGRSFHDAAPTYAALWEFINGAGSWDTNPWVWCLSFRRISPCCSARR